MREALAFLTVLPAGRRAGPPGRAAVAAFPAVGLLVGGLWWGAGHLGTRVWGPLVASALAVVADLLVTGGLHIDGLADEADGIASRKPSQEAVAIMREGSVGAIGAAAVAAVLLLRFALLATAFSGGRALAVVAAPVAGRLAMVWALARGGGRRAPKGATLAAGIRDGAQGAPLVVAGLAALAAAATFAGVRGVAGLAAACLVAEANSAFAVRRFGGVTGDVIGAGGLLAETVALALVLT